MNIPDFLRGFAKPNPTPINVGDTCRNTETGIYTTCLNLHQNMYYGKTFNGMLSVTTIDKQEKV